MGVPKFYRWLSERYPQINQMISDNSLLPEIDNLYLDMNGIIHACTHPNDDSTASTLTLREMMLAIFRYIDRMVTEIAKPQKLLFMAIDGVAPRAKLNQQRARRFRAAQDRIALHRAPNSWNWWGNISDGSSVKRSKKTVCGIIWKSFSAGMTCLEKGSIRLCNTSVKQGLDRIMPPTNATACTAGTPI